MLELRDDGSFDPHVRLPPFLWISGVAAPSIVDRESAGEADVAIHDQDSAMGAMPDPVEGVDAKRLIDLDSHPRRPHFFFEGTQGRAEAIDQEPHLDSGSRALGQRSGESGPERTLIE